MPAKHVVRNFAENSYYHVFNRGVEKRIIFLDEQDYNMFLYYLSIYLLPLEQVLRFYPNFSIRLYNKNLSEEIELISYCLMPNHFHLLLKQKNKDSTSKLIKQVTNGYTLYFNTKYERVGGLFQGVFKAVGIDTDALILHVARYIHLNPVVANIVKDPKEYMWSSHKEYFDKEKHHKSFVNKNTLLSYFSSPEKMNDFVTDYIEYAKEIDKIKHLTLEN